MENRQFVFSLVVAGVLMALGAAIAAQASVGLGLLSLGLFTAAFALWQKRSQALVRESVSANETASITRPLRQWAVSKKIGVINDAT